MARLLWEHEGQVIKDYPFPKGSVTIGRRKENTIVFTNPEVSSVHARIDKVGTDYILTDLQSTNGTFVNSLKVLSHRLSHGDRISIGKNVLLFIGTEKAEADAERANIPLDRTVIIGGARHRKRPSAPGPKIVKPYVETAPKRNHLKVFLLAFFAMGFLVLLGFFVLRDKSSFLSEIMWKPSQGQKTEGTHQDERALPSASERQVPPVPNEEDLDVGDTERPSVNIEAIVWSSDAKNSFVVINGAKLRVGDSIEGKTIARIERDHVVLQSPEGESVLRLKFK
jgi:pSer/pThr/pTyr-binding forkhead associated (FHA) protein